MPTFGPYPRRRPQEWKTAKDVQKIHFIRGPTNKPLLIGRGKMGFVYAGRLQFNDGKSRRVAIKRFNMKAFFQAAPNGATMADFIRAAHAAIVKLRSLNIPIPKMGLVKMTTPQHPEGEYVLVMQMFASTSNHGRKSHFKNNKYITKSDSLLAKQQALSIRIRLFNAGRDDSDLLAAYRRPRKGVRPIDIDGAILEEMYLGSDKRSGMRMELDFDALGHSLNDLVTEWAKNDREYKILLAQARREAIPKLRDYLAKRNY